MQKSFALRALTTFFVLMLLIVGWYFRWPVASVASEMLPGNLSETYLERSLVRQIKDWEERAFDGCYGDRIDFNFLEHPDIEHALANIHVNDYLSFTLAPMFECGVVKKVYKGMNAGANLCARYTQLYDKDCYSNLTVDRDGETELTARIRGSWVGPASTYLSQYDNRDTYGSLEF